MAIDLPPNQEPQQIQTLESRPAANPALTFEHSSGTRYRVLGNTLLTPTQLRRAIADAEAPQDVPQAISDAYRAAGFLLVAIQYVERHDSLDIHVVEAAIATLDVPDPLEQYFEPVVGDHALTSAGFRRRAELAQGHAGLAGYDTITLYERGDDPHTVSMDIKVRANENNGLRLETGVSNGGNRFVGEYFGTAILRQSTVHGSAYRLTIDQAFSGQGASEEDGNLTRAEAAWDRIDTWGAVGASVAYTGYDYVTSVQTPTGPDQTPLDGSTLVAKASLGQILHAGRVTRLHATGGLEFVDDQLERGDTGQALLNEQFSVGAFRSTARHRFESDNWRPVTVALTGGVRQSLSANIDDNATVFNASNEEFTTVQLDAVLSAWLSDRVELVIAANNQLAFDALPQFEEWVLGGSQRIAAYLPGILVGDQGAYGILKMRREHVQLGPIEFDVEAFLEQGTAKFEQRFDSPRRAVTDAGVRFEARLWDDALEIAVVSAGPIQTEDIDRARAERLRMRALFDVTYHF